MRKPMRVAVVCGYLCLASGLVAGAGLAPRGNANPRTPSTPQELPQPLQIQQALRWARAYNFDLRSAENTIEQRLGQEIHAGRPVPTNPVLEAGAGNRSTPGGDGTDISITLSQEFWIGGQGALRHRAAEDRTESARLQLEFLQLAIRARTRRAFLNLLAAKEAVDTAQRLLDLTRDVRDYAKRRLKAGQATRLAVNTAAIGVGRAQAALAVAERDARRARLALARLLALEPSRPLKVKGELDPKPLTITDRKQLLNKAVRRRADLTAAAREVAAAQEELKLSRRLIIPNLTVFGFYEQENSTDDIVGGGISIPIPALHRFGGERKEAAARLQQQQIDRDAMLLTVRTNVFKAIADYRAARRQVSVLTDETLAAAEQNVELTQRAFRAGKVGAPAITTAQDNLFNVRRDYLDALDNLVAAGTALERTTGGLLVLSQAEGQAASGPAPEKEQ